MYYVVAVNIHNITAIDDTSTVGDYICISRVAFDSGVTLRRLHFRLIALTLNTLLSN